MKRELDTSNILWMELRSPERWIQFGQILHKLDIPHKAPIFPVSETLLTQCLETVFSSAYQAP